MSGVKLEANIVHQNRCKSPPQNTNRSNPGVYLKRSYHKIKQDLFLKCKDGSINTNQFVDFPLGIIHRNRMENKNPVIILEILMNNLTKFHMLLWSNQIQNKDVLS